MRSHVPLWRAPPEDKLGSPPGPRLSTGNAPNGIFGPSTRGPGGIEASKTKPWPNRARDCERGLRKLEALVVAEVPWVVGSSQGARGRAMVHASGY